MTNQPLIIMDERERGEIRDIFQKFPCSVQIETLPVADYVIASNIGIERKRGDDLTSSICDSRFFRQLFQLSQHYSNPILVLEEYPLMFDRDMNRGSIYGALLYVQYKWNISIIPSVDAATTVKLIWSLAKYFQKVEKFVYKPVKVKKTKISKKEQLDFLEGLFQVSEKKAKILLSKLKTPSNIVDAILQTKIIEHGSRKKVEGPFTNIKGFGPVFIEKNQELLTNLY